jgi:hypothetical protein
MTIIGNILGTVFAAAGIYCVYKGLKLTFSCEHDFTHYEEWPDGGYIEVCDTCAKSRYIWEQGESDWIMVKDIPDKRAKLQKFFDNTSEPKQGQMFN